MRLRSIRRYEIGTCDLNFTPGNRAPSPSHPTFVSDHMSVARTVPCRLAVRTCTVPITFCSSDFESRDLTVPAAHTLNKTAVHCCHTFSHTLYTRAGQQHTASVTHEPLPFRVSPNTRVSEHTGFTRVSKHTCHRLRYRIRLCISNSGKRSTHNRFGPD